MFSLLNTVQFWEDDDKDGDISFADLVKRLRVNIEDGLFVSISGKVTTRNFKIQK